VRRYAPLTSCAAQWEIASSANPGEPRQYTRAAGGEVAGGVGVGCDLAGWRVSILLALAGEDGAAEAAPAARGFFVATVMRWRFVLIGAARRGRTAGMPH
jgi:hypothetical protein